MISKKYKVAFVGAGLMAKEHAKAFADVPDFELVGVHSRTIEKAQQLATTYHMPIVAEDIGQLYEQSHADVVVVSVPELELRGVCQKLFQYPWKILVEKPAGYDFNDAQSIYQMAQTSKSDVYVALNRRHYHSTRTLLKELEKTSGQRFIQVMDQEDPAAARRAGRPELVVKNWMYANSIHLIDYFTFLGRGEITAVEPIIRWDSTSPSYVACKISYSSGDVGIYEAVWNRPGPWSVSVTVPEARYEMRPMEQVAVQIYGSRKLETLPSHDWDTQFKPGLRTQAEEMLSVLSGKVHELPTLAMALRSMELVQQVYC